MRGIAKNRKYLLASLILFLISAVFYGVISDFPKVISGYPDELRYVGIGRSMARGEGLKLHGLESDFQKIMYSICIMPAFWLRSVAQQIRMVGYLNSLLMASAIFPIYGLCRNILREDKDIRNTLVLGITFPAFVYTIYFMSEVIYLPLSLWVVYLVWRVFCTESFRGKLSLNALLSILCYLTYLNKEIALYFVIAYVFVSLLYCISNFDGGGASRAGNHLFGGLRRNICMLFFADEGNFFQRIAKFLQQNQLAGVSSKAFMGKDKISAVWVSL